MSSDNPIDKKQGAIKSSEVYIDRTLDIIKNQVGDTALKSLEGLMKPVSDALRMNNFILHSDGQMFWQDDTLTTKIRFDSDGKGNNIKLRLMMMDEFSLSQTVDIVLKGTTGVNSLTEFNEIGIDNNELIYLEIDRNLLLNAVSPGGGAPGELILENGIDGGSVAVGKRVLRASLGDASGMPKMVADMNALDQTASQTVNIPLASRFDWSDGVDTYRDVWWIPHGIRWPSQSRSVLGAVVVSGLDALPDFFVRNQLELQQALVTLAGTGGIITPVASFNVTSVMSVTKGTKILGKSGAFDNPFSKSTITLATGGTLVCGESAGIENVAIEMATGFGASGAESAVVLSGEHSYVKDCSFYVRDAGSTNASSVEVDSSLTKVDSCRFESATTSATAINQTLSTSTNNLWQFNKFTGITETKFNNLNRSIGVRSDYGMVPLGSIIPYCAVSSTNTNNSSLLSLSGANTTGTLPNYLGDGWVVCSGSQLPSGSPLRRGSNIYAPNLTDTRFLAGSTSVGTRSGVSSLILATGNLPFHSHSNGNYTVSTSKSAASSAHTHLSHRHVGGTLAAELGSDNNAIVFNPYSRYNPYTDYWTGQNGWLGNGNGNMDHAVDVSGDTGYTSGTGIKAPASTNTVSLNGMDIGGTSSGTGSGSPINITPNYISTIFIMRVK